MMEDLAPEEANASQGGKDMLVDVSDLELAGDGLMHAGVDAQADTPRRLFKNQRLVIRSLAALCLLTSAIAVIIAVSVTTSKDDHAPEHGNTISDKPYVVIEAHIPGTLMPSSAPLVANSFDQPTIAMNDPVGDKPSMMADDTKPVPSAVPHVASSFDQPTIAMNDPVGDKPSMTADDTKHVPSAAPHEASSFDQPSIAMNDPVGDKPSMTADDTKDVAMSHVPHSQAWAWLSNHPNFTSMQTWRKDQLLAMGIFYYSYNGDHWSEREKKNWMSYDYHECQWGWASANENECKNEIMQILRLDNQNATVQGVTPTELVLLRSLERLEIFSMELIADVSDVLPSQLTKLTLLDRLRFSDNQLEGTLPTYLGEFTTLTSLNFRENLLTGSMPTELGKLTNLKYLNLHGNKLTSTVPTELARLTNLVSLTLENNNFHGSIPSGLCALTRLEKLQVDCKKVKCAMECDCICKDPIEVRMTATPTWAPRPADQTPFPTNAIKDGIILGLRQHSLDALQLFNSPQFRAYAWLLNHPHMETMPEWRKEQLFALVTFYHSFAGVWKKGENNLWLDYDKHECDWGIGVCDFDDMFLRLSLDDAENVKGKSIPKEIEMLPRLEAIDMDGLDLEADFTLMLPYEELEHLPFVTLNLQGNYLLGSLPAKISTLKTLRTLNLGRNNLSGSVPSEIGLLQDLTSLTLQDNPQMKGQLPSELGKLRRLELLWLDRTNLSGVVPMEICHLPALQTLHVDCGDGKLQCPKGCSACKCLN